MLQKIYKCDTSGYFIEFILKDEYAYINTIICDYIHIKTFFVLLRNSIYDLVKLNIKRIRQTVSDEEWNMYLKNRTSWYIINNGDMNVVDIECSIDDFLQNYGVGIGLLQ